MSHPDSESAVTLEPRKSGGPVCEVCGNAAEVVYLDHRAGIERYFCIDEHRPPGTEFVDRHWEYPLERDDVFHELFSLDGRPWRAEIRRSRSQVEARHARMREVIPAGWRRVMFDWSIGADVDTETLRKAAEQGWGYLQDLYGTSTVLEGDVFWQVRNEAIWLRRAMIHVCIDQGAAKRWQLELTPAPLTFCAGTSKSWKRACGCVFADTAHASGGGRSYWSSWCPEHRASQIAATRR